MNIQSIENYSNIGNISLQNESIDKEESSTSFSQVIGDLINSVNDKQIESDNNIESLIKGEDVTTHEVMLSMQEAQISMELLIEMRNKMVEAYQEINSIQL